MKCPPHIHFINDHEPGYIRVKKGRKFLYVDEKKNTEITQARILDRINQLVIPPMWENVWICKDKNGHLQATGKDQRNRKQYIYHPDWVAYRQTSKFSRLKEFGLALPKIRSGIERHINQEGFGKEKILATCLKLLDNNYLRVGNGIYELENETYGLTTLRKKHLKEDEGKLKITYKAKSGKIRNISVKNRKLINLLKQISELPGYEVFKYQENGKAEKVDSSDVNEFIQKLSGDYFTAKDFRTWAGSVKAIDYYPVAKREVENNPRRKFETALIRNIARDLGNTVSTCRQYYIHPEIMGVLVNQELEKYENKMKKQQIKPHRYLKVNEQIALMILEDVT